MSQSPIAAPKDFEKHEARLRAFEEVRLLETRTRWLEPLNLLKDIKSTLFGRNIKKNLLVLDKEKGVLVVKLHNSKKAVVMSTERYDEMECMRKAFVLLVNEKAKTVLDDYSGAYDGLYREINASHRGVDALLSASDGDIGKAHQPGATETS